MAFSFGQPAQAAPAAAQASPFSFGASTAPKPAAATGGGFSFGAPSQVPQPATGGGLFGGQNTNQQQQQQGGFGSSLFGQPAQQHGQQQQTQPQTSSLFGSTNASNHLFGQSQQQGQQQNKPAFSFANNNAGPSSNTNPLTLSQLGSQPPYQQQQNNLLQQSTGILGGAGASTSSVNARDQNSQKRLGIPVNDKLEAIRAAWDVRDIQSCRFLVSAVQMGEGQQNVLSSATSEQHYFYNAFPPNYVEESLKDPNFGRRQDATGPRHDAMWLQTLRENPDRSK